MDAERLDLETVKQYDDSWWLAYLKENTVFDTEQIKAHIDFLIEQAERVQELEKEIERYKEFSGRLQLRNDNLTEALQDRDEEIKRLRQALENIKFEEEQNLEGYRSTVYDLACGALEGAK